MGHSPDDRIRIASLLRRCAVPTGAARELDWVFARIAQVQEVLGDDEIEVSYLLACETLIQYLEGELLRRGGSSIPGHETDEHSATWQLGTHRLYATSIGGESAECTHTSYETHFLTRRSRLLGPLPGLAYPGSADDARVELRWVLENVDGVDATAAEKITRRLHGPIAQSPRERTIHPEAAPTPPTDESR